MKDLKIKHVFHSGFQIDYKDVVILIDVFNHLEGYENKKIYCFATHSHGDHYHPDVLKLQEKNDVTYILSDDIQVDAKENIHFMKQGDSISVDGFDIKAYGTTDLGISFLIKVEGTTLFHSGDLNWWHWDDSDKVTQQHEKEIYFTEIDKIVGEHIDIAFVPVDARLKNANRWGIDHFIEILHPKYLIPMHFGKAYDSIQNLETQTGTVLIKSQKENTC